MSLNSIINKGLISVYFPIACIVTFITIITNYLVTHIFNFDKANIITAVSMFVSIFIGWIWWSYKIVKWKYWAFSQLTVEESYELYDKAISSSLIWPTGNIFNKTEIWAKKDLDKWQKINPEIQKIFKIDNQSKEKYPTTKSSISEVMISLIKTNSKNKDFIKLVSQLDAELAIKDGDDHAFYHQFNGIINLNYVIVAYKGEQIIGCGAIKPYNEFAMEVKRMFVPESARGLGIATQILNALETWAKDLGYNTCILETGHKQIEAIALYKKCNYQITSNYGQYKGVENSICFEKQL